MEFGGVMFGKREEKQKGRRSKTSSDGKNEYFSSCCLVDEKENVQLNVFYKNNLIQVKR